MNSFISYFHYITKVHGENAKQISGHYEEKRQLYRCKFKGTSRMFSKWKNVVSIYISLLTMRHSVADSTQTS